MALARIPPAALMRAGDLQDPRAQRTRRALLVEFERQLEHGGVQPSVTSVIRAAAVSRSAFYAHFASLEDLHVAAVRQVLDDFGSSYRTARATGTPLPETTTVARETAVAAAGAAGAASEVAGRTELWLPYEALFEHVAAHRHLFTAALTGIDSPLDHLHRALVEQHRSAIDHAPMRPAQVDGAQAAEFLVGGVLACLTRWLSNPSACSATRLAEQVTELMPAWLVDGRGVQAVMA